MTAAYEVLATLTNGSPTVTAATGAFTLNVYPGAMLSRGGYSVAVKSVDSASQLTLEENWPGSTGEADTWITRSDPQQYSFAEINRKYSEALEAMARGFVLQSATSLAIGTGEKVFTVPAGLPILPGVVLIAASRANLSNTMAGIVTDYAGAALTIDVAVTSGAGTFDDWNINIAGSVGPQGPDGKSLLNGTVDPTTEGVDGDFYINTSANTIFGPKASGSWPSGVSIVGPTGATGDVGATGSAGSDGADGADGADGRTVLNGTSNPTTEGSDGDFYINTATNNIFGPKASGSWPSGVSLVGPTGATGDTGATGSTGAAGSDGADGADGADGVDGARGGIQYVFSSAATMADPGSGAVRFNNATLGSITAIAISDLNADAVDLSAYLATWGSSTSTVKGVLIVQSADGGDASIGVFQVTGVTNNSGWSELAVTPVAGSIPSDAEAIVLTYLQTGNKGDPGSGSVSSVNGDLGPAIVLTADEIDISALSPANYTESDTSTEGHLGGIDTALGAILTAIAALVTGVSSVNGEAGAVTLTADDIDIAALSPANYTPADGSTEGHLDGIDDALAAIAAILATVLVDGDIGGTVQGYDANTAKYDDATANFTGTLQKGGVAVATIDDVENPPPNLQTVTSYTLGLTDKGKIVSMNNAAANTLAIPANATVAFPVGTVINVVMRGAGTTTIQAASGVTLNDVSAGGCDILAQFAGASLYKEATDSWIVSGNVDGVA